VITATWSIASRTPNSTVEQVACYFNNRPYSARSTSGAAHALCRVLVEAGCPDQSLEVRHVTSRKTLFTFESIHGAAKVTYSKDALVPWKPFPVASVARSGALSTPELPTYPRSHERAVASHSAAERTSRVERPCGGGEVATWPPT
jgi:hypothetical protein